MGTPVTRERPISFHGRSIRAILEGRKSATRRIIKPQPVGDGDIEPHEKYPGEFFRWSQGERGATFFCPYGVPGGRLWVREAFSVSGLTKYHETGNPNDHGGPNDRCCAYAATGTYKCGTRIPEGALAAGTHRWKPSIHMPRWASRLTLEITDVRVERVQDIKTEDIIAEGLSKWATYEDCSVCHELAREAFAKLWDDTNGAGAWDRNDWVWVVSFRKVDA